MAEKNKHETPIIVALSVFVIMLVCILLWMALSAEISSGIRWIRVGQLYFISLFTERYDRIIETLVRIPKDRLTPFDLYKMTQITAEAQRIPIAVITFVMAAIAFLLKEKHPFSRKLNIETLAKEHAVSFPITEPILKFNPLKANFRTLGSPVPDKLPLFAEALSPEEWVSHNGIPLMDGTIDYDYARRAFARQLGGRWKGVSALPWYGKALFAAFAMKASGQRAEADEMLGDIARCWSPARGLVLTSGLRSKINSVIDDPRQGRVIEKIAAQHYFVAPALLRCLQRAREQGGVLAPAQFLWLRGVDRHLWYALNNLGRSASHVEAAGSIAHYRAEKSAGKPIPNPQVDIAVDALMEYLKENNITQFPAKEYGR